ncbi:hypothetical protein HJFPF1_06096 [Paramyrothecium foliicola]|nr:hypothetical protein HJFPF1_06096 [Paramyrothecium foliicola]
MFANETALSQHLQDSDEHKYCYTCKRWFDSWQSLQQHWDGSPLHRSSTASQASFPNQLTPGITILPAQYAHLTAKNNRFCPPCNRQFVSKEALQQHLNTSSLHRNSTPPPAPTKQVVPHPVKITSDYLYTPHNKLYYRPVNALGQYVDTGVAHHTPMTKNSPFSSPDSGYFSRDDKATGYYNKPQATHAEAPSQSHPCPDCQMMPFSQADDSIFPTLAALNEHRRATHNFCKGCRFNHAKAEDLRRHDIRVHYMCSICSVYHGSLDELMALDEHKSGNHNWCEECGRYFSSASNLQAHSKTHRASITCYGCNRQCQSEAAMMLHFEAGTCPSGADLLRTTILGFEFPIHREDHVGEERVPLQGRQVPVRDVPRRVSLPQQALSARGEHLVWREPSLGLETAEVLG